MITFSYPYSILFADLLQYRIYYSQRREINNKKI
jgi:hypothetical protein